MATIEELNFKLVIDDKSFDKRIDAITKKAKEMNKTVTELMNISARNSQLTKEDVQQIRLAEHATREQVKTREFEARQVAKTVAYQEKLNRTIEGGNTALSRQSRLWREISGMAATYFSVAGAEKLVRNLVEISAEFEFQKTTLRAILQDVQSADFLYDQLKGLAVKSPFNFKELVTYAKQLSAYQIPVNELFETTKQLADVSSGLGVGMDRLVLAYGQVRSAAFLRGQEVRQFTEAGIPILDMLAKQFGEIEGRLVTAGEVFDKISKRQVPFEMVAKVFKDMTSEGGKFYNMQEIQADTLKGKISNLADAYQIMFSEIGEATEGALKGAVDWARSLAENYEQVGKSIAIAAVSFGGIYTALKLYNLGVMRAIALEKQLFRRVMAVAAKNPYVLIAAGVAAVATALYNVYKNHDQYAKTTEKYTSNFATTLGKERAQLDIIVTKLKLAEKGTKEYTEARNELEKNYGAYLEQLRQEGVDVNDLTKMYQALIDKIEAASKARIKFTAEKEIEDVYSEALSNAFGEVKDLSKLIGANKAEEIVLWQMVSGGFTEEQIKRVQAEYDSLMAKIKAQQDANNDVMASTGGVAATVDVEARIRTISALVAKAGEDYKTAVAEMNQFFAGAMVDNGSRGSGTPGGSNVENDIKGIINSIEQQISAIKRLKSTYDELAQYLTDDQIATMYGDLFTTGFNFDEQIQDLIAKLNKLGTEGQDAAQKIVLGLRLEDAQKTANDYKKLEQAIKDFNDYMDRWNPLDAVASNDVNFNVNDIVNKYKKKLATILDKEMEAKDKLYASAEAERSRGTYSDEAFESNLRSIVLLAGKEMASNRATFAEMLRKEGEKWVKSWSGLAAFDIKNFSQMTIGELENLQDAISNFTLEEIPADIREVLANSVPGGLESFVDGVKKWLGELDNKAELKQADKFMETANLIGKAMDGAAGSAEDLMNILASPAVAQNFKNIRNLVSGVFSNTASLIKVIRSEEAARKAFESNSENAGKSFESSFKIEKITSIVSLITAVIGSIVNSISGAIAEVERVNDVFRNLDSSLSQLRLNSGVDTLFGDVFTQKIRNASAEIEKYKKNLESIDLSKISRGVNTYGGFMSVYDEFFGKELVNPQGRYWQRGEMEGVNFEDLEQRLKAITALIDAYESGYKAYDKKQFESLKQYKQYLEDYIAAEESLMSVIKDDWGQIADTIVDSMLSAYDELGDATIGLADNIDGAFANIARSIIKSMLSSVLIENVINKAKDPLLAMYKSIGKGDATTAMQQLAAIRDIFSQEVPALGEVINMLGDMMRDQFGLDITGGAQSAENLANGIKGITENQADLLASFLNAIRADVAYNRQTMGTMSADLKVLLGLVPQTYSLEYYMSEMLLCQRTMMEDIHSAVTASEMGGTGFKVIMS